MNRPHRAPIALLIAGLMCLLAPWPAVAEGAGGAPQIILEKEVHFTAPDGDDALASPWLYEVEASGAHLRLRSLDRDEEVELAAEAITHEEELDGPVALSASTGEDRHHVSLLLPGGKGLEAVGSYSGMRERGTRRAQLLTTAQRRKMYSAQSARAARRLRLDTKSVEVPCKVWRTREGDPVMPTHWLRIPAAEFSPDSTLVDWHRSPMSVSAYKRFEDNVLNPYTVRFFAPVTLPEGAEIRELRAMVNDTSPEFNLTMLFRGDIATEPYVSGGALINGLESDCLDGREAIVVPRLSHTVDNERYAYSVSASWKVRKRNEAQGMIALHWVRIGYTLGP